MNRPSLKPPSPQSHSFATMLRRKRRFGCLAFCCAFAIGPFAGMAAAQAITIDTRGNPINGKEAPVDRRFAQIVPTKVPLTQSELDAKTRLELIRVLQSEQGFAMRPFPRGHKGLTLVANGKLIPAGEDYLKMVTDEGLCAKPGDRVVLTDVKFDHTKIVFDLNDGPDLRHRFLRHIQLGTGNVTNPVVQGDDQEATGARLTLEFKGQVPELTGAQVKALLAPLISFDVKTPIQAFTDTLAAEAQRRNSQSSCNGWHDHRHGDLCQGTVPTVKCAKSKSKCPSRSGSTARLPRTSSSYGSTAIASFAWRLPKSANRR